MKKKSSIIISLYKKSQIEHIHAATETSVDMMTKKTQALAVANIIHPLDH